VSTQLEESQMRYTLNPCKKCGELKAKVKRNPAAENMEPKFFVECKCTRRSEDRDTADEACEAWNADNPIQK